MSSSLILSAWRQPLKLRVGLIGLGPSWASRHKPALHALSSRYKVKAVCDPVAHRAEQVAAEIGAKQFDGFRAVAACENVDALLMLSARWYGPLPILAACDFGKAVYCGASVDLSADQADALRDRVRDSGIAFMAEFPKRFSPATTRLKELMATRLGRPKLLFCNERHASRTENGGNGPANMRRMVEMVDWCGYIVDRPIKSISGAAHGAPSPTPTESGACGDYSLVTLGFEATDQDPCGPLAQIACGSYVPQAWSDAASFRRPADMQVVCEHGIAFIDLPNRLVWFDEAGQHTESLDSERPVGEQLLMQFHRSVSSLVLQTASLEDAYRAASLVIAGQRSFAEGRRIEID